jgi:RNA polymerase sigma-70 factor (ECF subfamily)
MESILKPNMSGEVDGLLVSAREGSPSAFGALVRPHLRAALAIAAAITGSRDDAEDVVQDAMMSAWSRLRQLRAEGAFSPWFRRIVIRSAMRAAKKKRRVQVLDLAAPATAPGTEWIVEHVALDAALDALSPQDRAVVYLRFALDLSVAETAEALAVPSGTVKSRSHYALQRLRSAYRGGAM